MNANEISQMIAKVIREKNPQKLIEAIEQNTEGLLDNKEVRSVILKALKSHVFKKPAHRTADLDRDTRIFVEMSCLLFDEVGKEKKGLREKSAEEVSNLLKDVEASRLNRGEKVPKEFAVSAEQVLRIYRAERKKRGYEN